MCTFNGSDSDKNPLFLGMGFGSEDIKINRAKAELEMIRNIVDTSFYDVSDVTAESSKAYETLTSGISKAEELTNGFDEQIAEIQSVLTHFCLQHDKKAESVLSPYSCSECDQRFMYPNLLDIHMKLHKRRYACDICGKKYQKLTCLEKHKKFGHVRTFDCRYCGIIFSTFQAMRVHENKIHENPKPIPEETSNCANCNLKFSSSEDLEKHTKSCMKAVIRASYSAHSSPAYNPIVSPAYSVRSLPNLGKLEPGSIIASPALGNVSSPQITVTKIDTTCPFCNREPFATGTSRDRHIRRFHPNLLHLLTNDKFHIVKIKNKGRGRIKTNAQESQYVCRTCGRNFTDQQTLNRHESDHRRHENDSLVDFEQAVVF